MAQTLLQSPPIGLPWVGSLLPLRGVLKCHCSKYLTGAPSRSRSGKYINYYKCQIAGHNNINADKAHNQLHQIWSHLSVPEIIITAIKTKSEELLVHRMKENVAVLSAKRTELEATEIKLKSIEEKFILNQLNFESYSEWHRNLSTQRMQLRSAVDTLTQDENHTFFLLKNNLDLLIDMGKLYQEATLLQKQELIRQGFDNKLYYQNSTYRTPYVMPIFTHNLLTLKQKSLLIMDEFQSKSGQVEATGLLSNQLIDLIYLISTVKVA